MPEELLGFVMVVLAVVGAVALVRRAFRSALRLALHAAEATAASGLAEVSARRGDLTGLSERRAHQELARQRRRAELALLLFWGAWLIVPPIAGWLPEGYALAALAWLLPTSPVLRPLPPPEAE